MVEQRTENPCVPGSIPGGTTYKESFFGVTLFLLLLSGKIKNAVANGLRSALPLARARKPNNHIAQGSALPFIHIFDNSQHLTFAEEIVKSCFESCISWT